MLFYLVFQLMKIWVNLILVEVYLPNEKRLQGVWEMGTGYISSDIEEAIAFIFKNLHLSK